MESADAPPAGTPPGPASGGAGGAGAAGGAGGAGSADGTDRAPPEFLWGAATSSHQVEGGNRWNDWWAFERSGRLPFRSGDACRHYERFEADFDLAAAGGHNAHRFSVEWSRIEPAEGRWDDEALAHYASVAAALRERGMEPIVTLHHFTSPAWFAKMGGWTRSDAPRRFARYVDRVCAALGDVRFWLTINEPTVYVKRGFLSGDWPPCRPRSPLAGFRALRQLCRAHLAAYDALRRRLPDARVGLAHSAPLIRPCRPERAADRAVARRRDFAWNDLVFRLLSRRPWRAARPRLDFLGVNYYTRSLVHRGRGVLAALFGEECHEHAVRGPFSDLGWEVHPDGLLATLERFATFGVPLMVTENGIATRDETLRSRYLDEHLDALRRAIERGADVIGYLHWTLMDNYEWTHGTGPRFGLLEVDFETQARTPRPAFHRLARAIAEGPSRPVAENDSAA